MENNKTIAYHNAFPAYPLPEAVRSARKSTLFWSLMGLVGVSVELFKSYDYINDALGVRDG